MVPKSHLCRNEIYFDSIRVNAKVYLRSFPLGRPCQLFLFISFKTLILFYQQKLETRTNPHSEVVRNVSMSNHQANVPEALPNFAQGFGTATTRM